MEGLDGLVHFTDVVTQSNNTHKSVPIILSAASAENYGVIYDEKSIVTAFKEAGFRTLVIANQKLTTSMIGAFYREADTFIDMSTLMIIEMRPVCMEDDKHILVRFIQFLFQIRQKGGIIQ